MLFCMEVSENFPFPQFYFHLLVSDHFCVYFSAVGDRGHGESSWLLPSGESFAALSGHPALR